MSRAIRIDFARIDHVYQHNHALERKTQILMRKNAIYDYRQHLLESIFNIQLGASDLDQTEQGKPYLNIEAKTHSKLAFNHSHSQNFYALATSNGLADIGIDIEELDRRVRFEALAQHAFHPNELSKWHELDQDKAYWFKVWTTKEAVLKASGLGIRMSLKDLDTQVNPIQNGGICQHPLVGVFAYQNYVLANCVITVAWRSELSCKGFAFPKIEIIQH